MPTHRRLVANDGDDFYVTPAYATEALLKNEKFHGPILEPCCGNGAMSKVLEDVGGYVVYSSDVVDRGFGLVRNFFDYDCRCPNIVTNPPFNQAEEMLELALNLAQRKVCFLLRTAFVESIGRYERFFSKQPPTTIYVFSRRVSIYPASSTRTGGGTTSYSWFVWDRQDLTGRTYLRWIEP